MALDRACMVDRKFTQCVLGEYGPILLNCPIGSFLALANLKLPFPFKLLYLDLSLSSECVVKAGPKSSRQGNLEKIDKE